MPQDWSAYAKPGPYVTPLSHEDEGKFQNWVIQNSIPWQDSPTSDYDMRGFWKAQQGGDPYAQRNANNLHFPDTWKTPYHKTFSDESKYALPTAGHWEEDTFVPPVKGAAPGLGQDPDERYMRKMENKYVEEPARDTARRNASRALRGYGSKPVSPNT